METDLDQNALAPQDYQRWSDWCYNNCTLACKSNALKPLAHMCFSFIMISSHIPLGKKSV